MTTYKELLAQKQALDQQIADARKGESKAALANVLALIAEFGFTAQQVFPWKPATVKAPAKYLDPDSGATFRTFAYYRVNGAILDGIRWGYVAAVSVEMGGGAMMRTILPGGIAMTHEWAKERDARPQIDAALDAIASARDDRVTRIVAEGAGE